MEKGHTSHIAQNYWSKWMKIINYNDYDESRGNNDDSYNDNNNSYYSKKNILPYHVLNFIRISKLWRKGGIFTDFSFIFLGPLEPPVVMQGFYMNSNNRECSVLLSNDKNSYEKKINHIKNTDDGYIMQRSCFISTLLVFNTPKSLILSCVLQKYEEPSFIMCLEKDRIYGGALCIDTAFQNCFLLLGFKNDLHSFSIGIDNQEIIDNHDFDHHEKETSNEHKSNQKYNFFNFHNDKNSNNDHEIKDNNGVLEVFNGNPFMASQSILSTGDWILEVSKCAFYNQQIMIKLNKKD